MARDKWTRDELIVAFNLYCKIPFGRIHNRNPAIIALAKALGRSPNAVSWKLANFARLDPSLKQRKIAGATHGGKGEIEVWEEFSNDWERLAFESEQLLARMTERELEQVADIDEAELPKEGKERERIVRARVNQHFFRVTVLASYDFRCCITGLAIPELLTASHIAAWSRDPKNRMNPRNGLALNALHDRAFDRGLMGIGPDWKVRFAPVLKRQRTIHDEGLAWLLKFEGKEIARPRKFHPDAELLAEHRKRYNL